MNDQTGTRDVAAAAKAWLERFADALEKGHVTAAANLFVADCLWRDLVAFTWNIKTVEGRAAIAGMLSSTLARVRPSGFAIEGQPAETTDGTIEAWFTFETGVGRGKGHVRLKGEGCWTLLTTLSELKGFEERTGPTREIGVVHGAIRNRKSWLEQKREEEAALGITRQPYCIIIGGGQGGIGLGARLKRLGVPTIILEKNAKPGDSWRNRYKSLVLHDPVWYDHLPYLPFPDHWPVFTPKDKLADWLEMYVRVMELDYWGSSEVTRAAYDETGKEWTVNVTRDGEPMTLRCKQLVFATGAYGPPNEPVFPGAETFKGEQYHSSKHTSGERFAYKRCLVVGSNSSAHDICVDLWESGADVTMLQRSPTTVVRSETLMDLAFGDYSERALKAGITTEKADMMFATTPFRLKAGNDIPVYRKIAEMDADFYERLGKAGFLYDFGVDGSGLVMKAWRTGSGYYIDVGGSDLIARGEIRLKTGVGLKEIRERSVVFSDGSEMAVDLIVYATGYQTMDVLVAKIVSPEVASRVGRCWGYGSGTPGDPGPWEGEVRNLWKPTAQKGLWFHGGNLHLSRQFSHYLALQIKARMEGIATPVYQDPAG